MNRREWFIRLAALLAVVSRPWRTVAGAGARQGGIVRWMWSGALAPGSVTVVAKVTGATPDVRLRVRASTDGREHVVPPDAPRVGEDIFRFSVTGLAPATRYTYQVVLGDVPWPVEGAFRTTAPGPHDAVVIFGSCASTGSNASVWDTMRAVRPDLVVHMGDLHYENITRNEPHRFHAAFDRCLTSPRQGAFFRQVPVAYVWDDHDFGGDESDRLSPSAPAAHAAYRACVPHYPLATGAGAPIYQAFDIGRVRFIVTDVRSARDAADGARPRTMLGPTQLTWLLGELEAASRTAPLVVWANGVPWITKRDETTPHGWAPFAEERKLIAAHIERLGLTRRLIMISGDAHMVAIDDGTNSQYADADGPGFVVAHGASFDRFRRNKGGPYSQGSRAGRGQFGELRVVDTGERLEATITCRDSRGRQIDNLSLRLVCAGSTGAVAPAGASAGDVPRAGAA